MIGTATQSQVRRIEITMGSGLGGLRENGGIWAVSRLSASGLKMKEADIEMIAEAPFWQKTDIGLCCLTAASRGETGTYMYSVHPLADGSIDPNSVSNSGHSGVLPSAHRTTVSASTDSMA